FDDQNVSHGAEWLCLPEDSPNCLIRRDSLQILRNSRIFVCRRHGIHLGVMTGVTDAEVSPMRGMQMKSLWGGVAAGALLLTYGCGAQNASGVQAQQAAQAPAGQPAVVSCEPGLRPLVRRVVVNGATIAQIECVAAETQAAAYAQPAAVAQPAPVYAQAAPRTQPQVVYRDLEPARVETVRTESVARP